MSGVKGRSGRKPKSLARHLVDGTYRADRHGPLPTGATIAAQPGETHQPLSSALLAGLGEPGLQFVIDLWEQFVEWSPASLALLHEAALVVDALHSYQIQIAADGSVLTAKNGRKMAHPLLQPQARARALLVKLIHALNIMDEGE